MLHNISEGSTQSCIRLHIQRWPSAFICGLLTHTYSGGEDVLIIDERLYPVHQQVHVLESRQLGGLLVVVAVLPPVLVPQPPRHDGTRALGAVLAHCAIDQVDPVKEIHHVNGNPVVEVLPLRELHHFPQVQAGLERGLGLLVEFKSLGAGLKPFPRPECFVFAEHLSKTQRH